MAQYAYTGLRAGGEMVHGEVEASNQRDAFTRLRELGVHPTELAPANARRAAAPPENGKLVASRTRLPRTDVAFLTRQLSDLVGAGLPLHRSLDVAWSQAQRPAAKAILAELRSQVQQGTPLSEALATYPRCFPELYRQMVAAGESSGHLGEVLERLAEFLEQEQVRRTQLIGAFTYPLVLVCVAIGAIIFMMTFLIPRLGAVFTDMRQSLPLPTQMLLSLAGFIGAHWLVLLAAAAGGGYLLWRLAGSAPGRRVVDAVALRLPLVGGVATRATVSRFARTLGTMIAGGVPILHALEVAAGASGNVHVAAWARQALAQVREGVPVNQALAEVGRFPVDLVQMVAVGEETASLPRMLGRLADSYDFQVDQRLRRLTALVEPAIIVVMGGLVGFIVLSILLPIFQINATIR